MRKLANTEASEPQSNSEETPSVIESGGESGSESKSAANLTDRQANDLKISLKMASSGIYEGKSLDLSSESSSLLGDAIDAIVSPLLLSTPSRELERYIKNKNTLFSSNKEINSSAKKTFNEKIVSVSKRIYRAKFSKFINLMKSLSSSGFLSLGASNDISNIQESILDYHDKNLNKPVLSSDSPYKVILNDLIPMLRQKFDAVVSFDNSLGSGDRIDYINISQRMSLGSGSSEEKAELVRFYHAIEEWWNILSLLDGGEGKQTYSDEVPPKSKKSDQEGSPKKKDQESSEVRKNIPEDIFIEAIRPGQYSHEDPTGSGSIYIDERVQSSLDIPVIKLYLRGRDKDKINSSGSGEEFLSFLITKGYVEFFENEFDVIREVTRESVSGGSELSLYLKPDVISSLRNNSGGRFELLKAETRRGSASVYVDSISQIASLKRVASVETTVYYQAVSPSGEVVSFSPADLVIGGGKIKDSKGKSFKPTKKLKGKSLADKVMSKGFGKVKRK